MAPSANGPGREPRLLILTPDYPPARGGIQLMSERHAEGIAGFRTRVVTLDSPGAREYDDARAPSVERVGAAGMPRGARSALLNAEAVRRALTFRPDVTLSFHVISSPGAAAIRRRLRARMVQVFHAEEIGMRPKLAAFAAREADVVVAVSSYTASLVRGLGSTRASMRLIPPGVDLPADPTPSLAEQPTVLTVARMEERYKGHDMIVRAWPLVRSRLPGARWIVIGDGRLRRPTEALVASYGIADSVSFLGELDDGERDAWLRRAHLLAMPSRLPGGAYSGEGFGIAYLEAGAFRKPVVAGNVGGALDSVADGESGLLVDPTDPVAVAQAISRLLLDPVLAARLGDGGRARAERLSWSAMTARMRDVLLETIGRAGADAAGA